MALKKKNLTVIQTRWQRTRPGQPASPTVPAAPPPAAPAPKPFEHMLNDPTTPDMVEVVAVAPPAPKPPIYVKSFVGGGYPKGSAEWQAANCQLTITRVLNYYSTMTDKPLTKWAGTGTLYVLPRAGVDLNAYYDRRNLKFFYATHPLIGGTVFAADSADIVSHELGHGILDGLRPDMWSAAALEVQAFHEAFGDFTSLVHSLQYDMLINRAIQQTNSNLKSVPSIISKLAEQFGIAISKLAPNTGRSPEYLRCAISDFRYVDPGTLPPDGPNNHLAAESHSFSRVFLSVFWDLLMLIHEDIMTTGVDPIPALKQARDVLVRYVLKAVQNAPLNVRFYQSMAKTILWADVTMGNRKYHDRMQQVFFDRGILAPQVGVQSVSRSTSRSTTSIVRTKDKLNVKLGHVMLSAQSGSNPLYDVEIEIPHETAKLYDNNGHFYDSCECCKDTAYAGAADMLNFLHKTNRVSDHEKTPFAVRGGKLVRTHFACNHKEGLCLA